jgi:DNA-binding transcriptional ArsR family regulator
VLELLRKRPLTAGELSDHFQVSKPTMSAHFAVLREANLVRAVKSGKTVTYQLKLSVLEDALLTFAQRFEIGAVPKTRTRCNSAEERNGLMASKRILFGLVVAGFILGAAQGLKYAQAMAWLAADASRRTMQVIIGLILAAYANHTCRRTLPHFLGPRARRFGPSRFCGSAAGRLRSRVLRRPFCGYSPRYRLLTSHH